MSILNSIVRSTLCRANDDYKKSYNISYTQAQPTSLRLVRLPSESTDTLAIRKLGSSLYRSRCHSQSVHLTCLSGPGHVSISGDVVTIRIDQQSGSRIHSVNRYAYGVFTAWIKCPQGDTTGLVPTFYTSSLEGSEDKDEVGYRSLTQKLLTSSGVLSMDRYAFSRHSSCAHRRQIRIGAHICISRLKAIKDKTTWVISNQTSKARPSFLQGWATTPAEF